MFHLVSYWLVLEEPNIYQNLVDFTRIGGDCGGLSDCEELSGGYLPGMIGFVFWRYD